MVDAKGMNKADVVKAVNTPQYWSLWSKAGGDVDEYIKDSLTNYGVIGALLITVSLPSTLSPPELDVYGDSEMKHYTKGDFEIGLYAVFMALSTACSILLILLSTVVYTQYVCCVDKETRTAFAKQYAFMIPVLTALMTVDVSTLMLASNIMMFIMYGSIVGVLSIISLLGVGGFFLFLVPHMVHWNVAENYGPVVLEKTSNEEEEEETETSLEETVEHFKQALEGMEALMKQMKADESKTD